MEKTKGVKLSLTMNGNTVTFETPTWDLGADDIIEAFYGLMVAQTFSPNAVVNCMKDFVEDRLPEEEEA